MFARYALATSLLLLTSVKCREIETDTTSGFGDMPWDVIIEPVDRYILPLMPYWYQELEPHIEEETLSAHHMGEHNVLKTYMNRALKTWRAEEPDNEFARNSILRIVMDLEKVPEKYRTSLRNHGGGFVNHCFYFGILSPNENDTEREPEGKLLEDINTAFGDKEGLKKAFTDAAKDLFGAGYVWLVRTPGAERPNLKVMTTANQDSPVSQGLQPILVLDLWEHAYYLKNHYKKWEHIKDFWLVVDWNYVAKLDQWWDNLDEEEKKADERIKKLRQEIDERIEEQNKKQEL